MIAFIIEDEREQRNLVCRALEEAGWTVELADDGIAALGRIRRMGPDVILLDLRLPQLDGIEMLKILRSSDAERAIPVIVMTGYDVDPEVRQLATCVLTKPFSARDLTDTLASCVGGS